MKTKLTSKYYLLRIFKSKDLIDLSDAVKAYNGFIRDRQAYAVQLYCESVRKADVPGIMEATTLQFA